jgi:hypothetical protein
MDQAEQFRLDVMEYPEWPEEEQSFADILSYFIEIGCANYNSRRWIITIDFAKCLQAVADGELLLPPNALLHFTQQPMIKARLALVEEGFRILLKIDGKDTLIKSPPYGPVPSIEELLNDD